MKCKACGANHDPAVTLCDRVEAAEAARATPRVEFAGGARRTSSAPAPDGGAPHTSRLAVDQGAVSTLAPGTVVGEFVIEGQIGSGGMGVVYRATHPLIGKKAVVKVIKASLGDASEHTERFIREARAVNQIGHPNIVDVFSFGTLPDRRPYLIMEWLQGESLGTRLDRGHLPLREGLEILLQICSALDAAHTYGVVHRDLKPDNVYLVALPNDDRPLVKLLDFGLAKIMEPKDDLFLGGSHAGVILGTPTYLSPEQARGQPADHRSDVYTLGIMAFEMFTGRRPFVGMSPIDTILLHVSRPPPAARSFAPDLPAALDELLLQLMAKEPTQRPTVSRVRQVLTRVLAASDSVRAAEPREEQSGVHTSNFAPGLRQLDGPGAGWTGHASTPLSDLEERRPEPVREEATRMDPAPGAAPVDSYARDESGPIQADAPGGVRMNAKTTTFQRVKLSDIGPADAREDRISSVAIPIPVATPVARAVFKAPAQRKAAPPPEAPPPTELASPVLLTPDVLASLPLSIDEEPTLLPKSPLSRRISVAEPDAPAPSTAPAPTQQRLPPVLRGPRLGVRLEDFARALLGRVRNSKKLLGAIAVFFVMCGLSLALFRLSGGPPSGGDRVRVLVHGLPTGSTLSWDKKRLDDNPSWVERGSATHKLEIASPGYDPFLIDAVPTSNLEFTVQLGERQPTSR